MLVENCFVHVHYREAIVKRINRVLSKFWSNQLQSLWLTILKVVSYLVEGQTGAARNFSGIVHRIGRIFGEALLFQEAKLLPFASLFMPRTFRKIVHNFITHISTVLPKFVEFILVLGLWEVFS